MVVNVQLQTIQDQWFSSTFFAKAAFEHPTTPAIRYFADFDLVCFIFEPRRNLEVLDAVLFTDIGCVDAVCHPSCSDGSGVCATHGRLDFAHQAAQASACPRCVHVDGKRELCDWVAICADRRGDSGRVLVAHITHRVCGVFFKRKDQAWAVVCGRQRPARRVGDRATRQRLIYTCDAVALNRRVQHVDLSIIDAAPVSDRSYRFH